MDRLAAKVKVKESVVLGAHLLPFQLSCEANGTRAQRNPYAMGTIAEVAAMRRASNLVPGVQRVAYLCGAPHSRQEHSK
jgi:hypothetical protein